MGLLDLFVAASNSVLKLLLLTALGSVLALDHVDILGEDTRKLLNRVVFYVFSPAIVASNLAKAVTFQEMVTLWFMPLNILITYIIGSVFGWIIIQITDAPLHLRGLIIGSCSAGNLGNLLLIIIPEVCKEKGSPFGIPDVCQKNGLAYVSISMASSAVYLWLYVYNIVGISTRKSTEDANFPTETSKLCESSKESLLEPSSCASYADHSTLLPTASEGIATVSISMRFQRYLSILPNKMNWKRLLAPSTSGAIVGLIIGTIPPIRRSMIGESAPLHVIEDSASLLGNGAIPCITLILGGNLTKGLNSSGTRASFIIGIIVARNILLPLSGIFIVKGALNLGLIQADPLYQFVLMLHFAVPPAMNIGTITQLFGAGQSECSIIMLWTYAVASVSLTLWSTLFMWLVS